MTFSACSQSNRSSRLILACLFSLAMTTGCATRQGAGGAAEVAANPFMPAECARIEAQANPAEANRVGTIATGAVVGAVIGGLLGALTGDERIMAAGIAAGAALGGAGGVAVANRNERAAANEQNLRACNEQVQTVAVAFRDLANRYDAQLRAIRADLARADQQLRRGRMSAEEHEAQLSEKRAEVALVQQFLGQGRSAATSLRSSAQNGEKIGDVGPQLRSADSIERDASRLEDTYNRITQQTQGLRL